MPALAVERAPNRAAPPGSARAGFTTLELLVGATVGLLVAAAALSLCAAGNRAVAALTRSQTAWQESRAAAALWAAEWRGAGYDPTGAAGARLHAAGPETLDFSGDWNGDGALVPTAANPNERLAHALEPGTWRRGVNGGPRLAAAWPDSARFILLDRYGANLGSAPQPAAVSAVEARVVLEGGGGRGTIRLGWTVARRNADPP